MAYEINYEDPRFKDVESDRKEALSETEKLYSGMMDDVSKHYQAQIDASKEWAETQAKNQQAQTDFAIDKIEQQKAQANKDYTREQSGAYVDWQKESNRYGVNAEEMASQGFINSGYAESSQVSMYNTYQNRVATARESYNLTIQNYNNAITEARMQNNAALAQIAYEALQDQLQFSLEGFQYKNQLLSDMVSKKEQVENRYDNKYQAVLDQMNKENALQEELRQFNANYSLQQQKLREEIRQAQVEEALSRAKMAQDKAIANAQLAEQRRQHDAEMALARSKQSGGSTTSSKKSSSGGGSTNSTKKSGSSSTTSTRTPSSGSRSFGSSSATNLTTYEQAADYLRNAGVTKGDGGLMTKSEWSRRRASGSSGAEAQYSSYSDYLNNYVAWKKSNPD